MTPSSSKRWSLHQSQYGSKRPAADASHYTITAYLYDADGRLVSEIVNCTMSGTSPPGDPAWRTCSGTGTSDWQTNTVTSYAYDARGNRTKVTAPDPSADSASVVTVVTRYAFDAEDRLCRVVAHATISDAVWDALADKCVTAIGGSTTENVSSRYTYDGAGNLATMVDAAGHPTTYGYDTAGRQTSTTDALGRTVTAVYDALGRPTSGTDRVGNVVAWTYDAAGRVLSRTAGGVTTTYAYDDNGNRLTAVAGGVTITTTYDRLNRPKTVTVSDDGGAATTYTYSLTAPSWTDPTGTYLVTLDKFDRQATLDDPATSGTWAFAYRADGQPASVTPPSGPATSCGYDTGGRFTSKTTGAVASFVYTLNRAGLRRTETATVTSDPKSGQAAFGYDQLGRLTGYTPPGSGQTTYGWAAVPNRTAVTPPGGPTVSTTFDAANRPTGTGWSTDLDGRITAIPTLQGRPAMTFSYDALGRLVSVTAAGVTTTYAYDPLDRLRTVSRGGSAVRRFRYVGVTGTVAQLLDGAGAVVRSVGSDWSGARLTDWTGTGQNLRYLGTNGHGDLVYTLDSAGAVTAASRLDPWGAPLATVPSGFPEFRFQGSWADPVTELAYAVARWYAPTLGTFTSEDALAGDTADPPSRHLYAYGAGDPVDRADPTGMFWYRVRESATFASVAIRTLGNAKRWPMLWNANRSKWGRVQPSASTIIPAGSCYYVPIEWLVSPAERQLRWRRSSCRLTYETSSPRDYGFGYLTDFLRRAQATAEVGEPGGLFSFTRSELYRKTDETTNHRPRQPSPSQWSEISKLMEGLNKIARGNISAGVHPVQFIPRVWYVEGRDHPIWCGGNPCTVGQYIFLNRRSPSYTWLLAHEYIHVIQQEGRGLQVASGSILWLLIGKGLGPDNPEEAAAYLWEAWIYEFGQFESFPWRVWVRPPVSTRVIR